MSVGLPTALPRPLAGFKGAASLQEGNGGEGRRGEIRTRGEGREMGGERGNGEGSGKRGSWGIVPCLLGDKRP